MIDDGFNARWVEQAFFDGILEIPHINKPKELYIPQDLRPFSLRKQAGGAEEFVCFYEHDKRFYSVLKDPEKYIGDLKKFKGVITPDPSLYIDMPLCLQVTDVYLNRAIGCFFQEKGMYVIPNIRWGDERTYTTCVLPEKVAFLGVDKHSIVAVGSYGQVKGTEDKRYFIEGFLAMLEELEPEIILVYGPLPRQIRTKLPSDANIILYTDWISKKKAK